VRVDGKRLSSACRLTVSVANRDRSGLCVGIGANPVFSRTQQCKSQAGRIDLEILPLPEIPDAGRQRTLRQLDLHRLVIQI
jgi:hypothetical protein